MADRIIGVQKCAKISKSLIENNGFKNYDTDTSRQTLIAAYYNTMICEMEHKSLFNTKWFTMDSTARER